jgi:hypothetical protein
MEQNPGAPGSDRSRCRLRFIFSKTNFAILIHLRGETALSVEELAAEWNIEILLQANIKFFLFNITF